MYIYVCISVYIYIYIYTYIYTFVIMCIASIISYMVTMHIPYIHHEALTMRLWAFRSGRQSQGLSDADDDFDRQKKGMWAIIVDILHGVWWIILGKLDSSRTLEV